MNRVTHGEPQKSAHNLGGFFVNSTLEDFGLRGFARFASVAGFREFWSDTLGLAVSKRLHSFAGRTVRVAHQSTNFSLGLADSLLNRVRWVNSEKSETYLITYLIQVLEELSNDSL